MFTFMNDEERKKILEGLIDMYWDIFPEEIRKNEGARRGLDYLVNEAVETGINVGLSRAANAVIDELKKAVDKQVALKI